MKNNDLSSNNFFLKSSFLKDLELSDSIGKKSGWHPVYFEEQDEILFTFIKTHSYGEYIFDWEWARTYQNYQLNYYPKLTSMIPFTPATTDHFTGNNAGTLMDSYEEFYTSHPFSSSHFLFISEKDKKHLNLDKYLLRDSFQYHFHNLNFSCFDDFLETLKSKKAKQIKSERSFSNLTIIQKTGSELSQADALEMYSFYLSTIDNKNAIPYLTKDFFIRVFNNMKENILYVRAVQNEQAVGGALFFYDSHKLYGRYWGTNTMIKNLHFELCYYQGIDFCIKKKIPVFEAGAQGEHKVARGFRPVKTFSAHHFKDHNFHHAIGGFIESERFYINEIIEDLTRKLPFKTDKFLYPNSFSKRTLIY